MAIGKGSIRIYDLAREVKQDTKRVMEDVRREGVDVISGFDRSRRQQQVFHISIPMFDQVLEIFSGVLTTVSKFNAANTPVVK